MPASCTRTAIYRVTWNWAGQEKDGATLEMGIHPDSPRMTLPEPWVGSLCEHEVSLLRGESSSHALSKSWSFDLETLFDASEPKRPMTQDEALEEIQRLITQSRSEITSVTDSLAYLRKAAELQGVYGLTETQATTLQEATA